MGREGISDFSEIMKCQVLDKYNLTDRKVPAITIKGNKIRFNMNAINLLGGCPYVEILINREEKYMLVVPCNEHDVFAVDWCKKVAKTGKVQPRDITSKFLSPKLYKLMGWSSEHSYKIQCFYQSFGKGQTLLFFDLTEYVTLVSQEVTAANGTVRKMSKSYYLASWADSFGPPLQKIVDKVSQDFRGYYIIDGNTEESESKESATFAKSEEKGELLDGTTET